MSGPLSLHGATAWRDRTAAPVGAENRRRTHAEW
jgi:hypothetical protein